MLDRTPGASRRRPGYHARHEQSCAGIATAFAIPTLVYQRQSVYAPTSGSLEIEGGWYVTRVDGRIYTLERPRFRLP